MQKGLRGLFSAEYAGIWERLPRRRGKSCEDGMKNAYKQGEFEEKRWNGGVIQKKIPCYARDLAFPWEWAGKKFPDRVVKMLSFY